MANTARFAKICKIAFTASSKKRFNVFLFCSWLDFVVFIFTMPRLHPGLVLLGTYGILSLVLGWVLFHTTTKSTPIEPEEQVSSPTDILQDLNSNSYDELKSKYDELVVDWLVEKGGEVEQYLHRERESVRNTKICT